METLRDALIERPAARVAEIVLVFLVGVLVVAVGWSLVGEGPLARQSVVWVANVLMMTGVWAGLRIRRQSWEHFGLSFAFPGWRRSLANVVKSLVVFIVAMVAFVLGSLLVPPAASGPQQADMSSYQWLQGNLPMLVLALLAVYVVSSFGEEVVYRGFLVNRVAELGGGGRWAYGFAVAVSAVVFGLAHFGWGIVGIIQTTCMGLALAIAYLLVKRLSVLVLAHGYLGTLLLVQIYLSRPPDANG